ncbi:MAG: BREX system P-loop protein BrxC [Desulfovibrionaceae bacterium]|nr:BREX system P-loop protein BrxC [Desulfovibrionaceae bacterium]
MTISELFEKDPFRYINGVIKAEDHSPEALWQELDEYVVTRELTRHFNRFFSNYVEALRRNDGPAEGSMGVWISGFFGSGKSHFLKILSYLLGNFQTVDPESKANRRASDFFKEKLSDPKLFADIKASGESDTDVILFNIDSRANSNDSENAILGVFWRVFDEMRGYYGQSRYVAAMEQHLDEEGSYEAFKQTYRQLRKKEWTEDRPNWNFRRKDVIKALSSALGTDEASATEWFESRKSSLAMSIDVFAEEVRRYIDRKGGNRRVVFLVDEVGQFIGTDTKRMLQLQTITENLGTACKGHAWVIVTSQEDIEAILGEFRASRSNDFSKIQGRFITRLSLSSSNTDEVIQYRLLRKNDAAKSELAELWRRQGDVINSRLTFTNDSATLKNFSSESDFITNYPFIPYQFQLVQKIFESIRKAGATGAHLARGERSMLDAFQHAMRSIAFQPSGTFIPLHAFYTPIESFLETSVKATIDRALDNPGLQPFDSLVLKTMFLIRYVELIKPNIDNITTLFIDEADADTLAIKEKVEASLQRLEHETLINRNGDLYYFLTNEERDISREIKNEDAPYTEQARKISEVLFSDIMNFPSKFAMKDYHRSYDYARILDRQDSGHIAQDMALAVITQYAYESTDPTSRVMYSSDHTDSVVFFLAADNTLERELTTYIKTKKYLSGPKGRSENPTQKRILAERGQENQEREKTIRRILTDLFLNAEVYCKGRELQLTGGERSTARAITDAALEYHVRNTFRKFKLLTSLQDSDTKCQSEIRSVLLSNEIGKQHLLVSLNEVNADAVREVSELLALSNDRIVPLQEISARYSGKPYGWPEWEVALLAARLYMAGNVTISIGSTEAPSPQEITEAMLKIQRWKEVGIRLRRKPNEQHVKKLKSLYKKLSGKLVSGDSADEVVNAMRDFLARSWMADFKGWQENDAHYPGQKIITNSLTLLQRLAALSDDALFAAETAKAENDLLDMRDDYEDVAGFYKKQLPVWDRMLSAFAMVERNRTSLEKSPEAMTAVEELENIRSNANPWNQLSKIDGLVKTIEDIRAAQLNESMAVQLSKIDDLIGQFRGSIEYNGINADGSNKILSPLQQFRKRIENAPTVADIALLSQGIEDIRVETADRLDREISSIQASIEEDRKRREEAERKKREEEERRKQMASAEERRKIELEQEKRRREEEEKKRLEDAQKRRMRKNRYYHISDLTDGKPMNTPEDVEDYINGLRQSLLAKLSDNETIYVVDK